MGSLTYVHFHVGRSSQGPWTTVSVVGEIDLATAPRFRAELLAATVDPGPVVLDLRDCDLIDSVGLGIIVGAARRLRSAEVGFVIVATDAVRRALRSSRLDEILTIESAHPEDAQAEEALG